MRNKLILGAGFVALLALITTLVLLWPAGQPQLHIAEAAFEMGTVPSGQVGRYQVVLTNTGSAPLLIQQIKPG